jgi:hypothetical protein
MYCSQKGELVWIPANVPLFKGTSARAPSHMIMTEKPEYALVLNKDFLYNQSEIFWGGEYYWVNNGDVFEGDMRCW